MNVAMTNLDELVPARGDDDGVLGVGAEADARGPLSVALLGDGVLAITEGVPELDRAVARAGNDLSVVGREAHGEDIVGVSNESSSGGSGSELPETQSLVPRGRQSVGTVGRDNLNPAKKISPSSSFCILCPEISVADDGVRWQWKTYTVGDDVGVAVERSFGVAVLGLIAGEVPDDQSLVSGSRQEHVGARSAVSQH